MATFSPKKSQNPGLSRDNFEGELGSQFCCPRCGIIGHTQGYLRSVHSEDRCLDVSKSGDESKCTQYQDVVTFDRFIDCKGHQYTSSNYAVCEKCFLVICHEQHLSKKVRKEKCDIAAHHCTIITSVFPFHSK